MYNIFSERMTGESVPKAIVKRINVYASEHGGPKYDEDEMKKKRKKANEKPTINVSYYKHTVNFWVHTVILIIMVILDSRKIY